VIFSTVMLDGFLLLKKWSFLMNWLPPPLPFFGLGVTKDAAKPEFILSIGDNGSCNGLCPSHELIIKINEVQLGSKLQISQNEITGNHTLISCTQFL
jgi:hypothetical protein